MRYRQITIVLSVLAVATALGLGLRHADRVDNEQKRCERRGGVLVHDADHRSVCIEVEVIE